MFILASASPRRKEILSKSNLDFKIVTSSIKEVIDENLSPIEIAESLSRQKALDVYFHNTNSYVLGFDTIVSLNDKIYPKPKNREEAKSFLNDLSGKTHQVVTGITIASKTIIITCSEVSYVTFKKLTNEMIEWYLNTLEWTDKAGGYAIQGYGKELVSSYEGDLNNIIGLPLNRLMKELDLYKIQKR